MVNRYTILFVLLSLFSFSAIADEEQKQQKKVYPSVETGIAIGGMFTDHGFTQHPLKTIHITANIPFTDEVFYGVGAGFESGSGLNLIPLYLSFKGMFDDEGNTAFISSRFGYSLTWSYENSHLKDYELPGGILFSGGVGYRFEIDDEKSLLLELGYHHQFLVEKYKNYEEELNLDMITLKVGVLF